MPHITPFLSNKIHNNQNQYAKMCIGYNKELDLPCGCALVKERSTEGYAIQ